MVSSICYRYAFSTYYTMNISEVPTSQPFAAVSAVKKYDFKYESISFAVRMLLTVGVELAAAWVFGYRKKKQIILLLEVNVVTQIILNVMLNVMVESECPKCHGRRLNEQALSVRVGDKNITEFTMMSVVKALTWIRELKLDTEKKQIADLVLKEINSRLEFLQNVGLDYLTLDRLAGSLSGGESQRIRLATQIGSRLSGVLYVMIPASMSATMPVMLKPQRMQVYMQLPIFPIKRSWQRSRLPVQTM